EPDRRGARACARRGDAGEGPTRRATGLRGLQLRVGWPRPGDDRPARRLLEWQDAARALASRGPASAGLRAEPRARSCGTARVTHAIPRLLVLAAVAMGLSCEVMRS